MTYLSIIILALAIVVCGLALISLICMTVVTLTEKSDEEQISEFDRAISRRAHILERMGK